MTAWGLDELTPIGKADELEVASRRSDGTLSGPRTIWVVRDGDDLYVRSVYGPAPPGFGAPGCATKATSGPAASTKDVTFEDVGDDVNGQVDAAYRSKYGRYAAYIIDAITSPEARSTTMRLVPRSITPAAV